jgi:hypothetical protein
MGLKAPDMKCTDMREIPKAPQGKLYRIFGRDYALRAYLLSRYCWYFDGYGVACGRIKTPLYRKRRAVIMQLKYIGWF